jgi:urate oxidase
MGEKLEYHYYGKSDVRVTKVIRRKDRHELVEISVDITLGGDFKDSYVKGDNRKVVATDSIKNTVYVLAKRQRLDSIESFGVALAEHFMKTYPQVNYACAQVRQARWKRINVRGMPHPHAFINGGNERRVCTVTQERGHKVGIGIALEDLLVLKTTDSAFSDFHRDEYTTLQDTDDRIFATQINAWWTYGNQRPDFNKAFDQVRSALIETFATHKSEAVQQTLYAMGQAALRRCKAVSGIKISLPNKHRLLVNLKAFGLENQNEIFVWTDEPFGSIQGFLKRS